MLYGSLWYLAIKFQFQTSDIRSWKIEWLIFSFVKANLSTIGLDTISCNSIQNNGGVGRLQIYIYHNLTRGRVRNFNLRVPLLNRWFTLERVPLNESQNFTGSAEPMEPVLTRPLLWVTQLSKKFDKLPKSWVSNLYKSHVKVKKATIKTQHNNYWIESLPCCQNGSAVLKQ